MALTLAWVALDVGCGSQVPAHEVEVWSDCSGEALQGRYAFDDHDFDTTGCEGEILTGNCDTPVAGGRRVSGDVVVERIQLEGTEHSAFYTYVLLIEPQPGQAIETVGTGVSEPYVVCAVYRDDEGGEYSSLGEVVDCYYSKTPCHARVEIVGD